MTKKQAAVLRITLIRSTIGRPADQGRTVASLGLRRLNATVERPNNPSIRGMVTKIRHLVEVEEVPAASWPAENGNQGKNERKAQAGS